MPCLRQAAFPSRVSRGLVIALVCALVHTLAGPIAAARAEDKPAPAKVSVLLDWFINPDHGPLIVAQDLGYFKDAGLEVDLVAPADPNDPPKLVAAGKADIAVGYQPQLVMQVAEGLPLMRFGTLVATPLNCLVVLKDGPIKSVADLKGRKVGFSVGGFEDALLGAMLDNAGVKADEVTLVNVNFSLSPAVISGQVDAVIGPFRNFELNQMDLAGHPGTAFYPEEHGVPLYDELVFVTNIALKGDPRLVAFLDAVERGTHYIVNHPEEAWTLFKAHSPDLDDELNHRAWIDTVARFSMTPGALDERRYARFAGFLQSRGLIKTVPPLASYAIEPGL
ncbi:ABC transporter substrate-binding protein [Rhodospirillum rubrum]|uniref:Sulfonate/nitrate transport system substrate-binding protein n=1 Tax=Rhodospirillum rubrum (strain ATCC 11170 / ATH 1.1.1 / DSM 467 / LMG 4362 / NCIMB 8255 / S1) TaxID=269796 RepID=Q2RTV3_RHORT|nr:ABC transporter substrate-binding protein [Rhodospirillum rubrum]ABC22442.1 putative sulfonate/nitrate transport system substrate-binding protein [Rhodospirillum rubrum ATCC 11170]AEO48160.1 putative sulfonate/nitrate transport system substrate-binding protein [Rhodospirillum rubrum F11]MBK5954024.1 ABC transporter ATP-binding protein [Rhodospirillum rubrum]QXG82077.1 ABC transporter substrate-binding protein [Rhodospirillum rubrum]HAP99024.1 ABC transporter ATP-binding protein [Rhodospiril